MLLRGLLVIFLLIVNANLHDDDVQLQEKVSGERFAKQKSEDSLKIEAVEKSNSNWADDKENHVPSTSSIDCDGGVNSDRFGLEKLKFKKQTLKKRKNVLLQTISYLWRQLQKDFQWTSQLQVVKPNQLTPISALVNEDCQQRQCQSHYLPPSLRKKSGRLPLTRFENCVLQCDLLKDQRQQMATASSEVSNIESSNALEVRGSTDTCSYQGHDMHLPSEHQDDNTLHLPDPHVGMILTTTNNQVYELVEPIELDLGVVGISHVTDYAFTPVLVSPPPQAPALPSSQDQDSIISVNSTEHASEKIVEGTTYFRFDKWWQWWLSWKNDFKADHDHDYRMESRAFAGGSHGEVWRGKRRCEVIDMSAFVADARNPASGHQGSTKDSSSLPPCSETLVFKRLKVDRDYRILEAGLREVHFGSWLAQEDEEHSSMYTRYVDHFFRERPDGSLELWIVFQYAGPTLRSYLYTPVTIGDLVLYQQSALWTKIRLSLSLGLDGNESGGDHSNKRFVGENEKAISMGKYLMVNVFRQILKAASFLHSNGVVHRDIKPSNVMCKTFPPIDPQTFDIDGDKVPEVRCVLGDLSSAWNDFTNMHFYTRGPSRSEQTDEYAPPEAIFGLTYNYSRHNVARLDPSFDSWSIGILGLEILLGTPNVFSVDQRTRAILTHKLLKQGASSQEIERALYLAALSQFCIYNPSSNPLKDWPLRRGDPLYNHSMAKTSCTLQDFHRAIRARDPLGRGLDSTADTLLHLIWQLLAWNPKDRISAARALRHPYFEKKSQVSSSTVMTNDLKALESQMLDPRMDFNSSDSVKEFRCMKCGRIFGDWNSCKQHTVSRKHGKFCDYDKSALPTCLSAHTLLPAHSSSGYCDIQGRRRVIEDFHSIHLDCEKNISYYLIADGHRGNLASKYVASSLYKKVSRHLAVLMENMPLFSGWQHEVQRNVTDAFNEIHHDFIQTTAHSSHISMDQSGTTATFALLTQEAIVIACLGDSRAVLATTRRGRLGESEIIAIQLTTDHVASNEIEQALVRARGGYVIESNGVLRVNGILAITRSIGDSDLSPFLSRDPEVISFSRNILMDMCGQTRVSNVPCFMVLASDGLWDTMTNQEAVELAAHTIGKASDGGNFSWSQSVLLQLAAEALTLEAYVRGSKDNIGVIIIVLDEV